MRAEISKDGELRVIGESALETYALRQWCASWRQVQIVPDQFGHIDLRTLENPDGLPPHELREGVESAQPPRQYNDDGFPICQSEG